MSYDQQPGSIITPEQAQDMIATAGKLLFDKRQPTLIDPNNTDNIMIISASLSDVRHNIYKLDHIETSEELLQHLKQLLATFQGQSLKARKMYVRRAELMLMEIELYRLLLSNQRASRIIVPN